MSAQRLVCLRHDAANLTSPRNPQPVECYEGQLESLSFFEFDAVRRCLLFAETLSEVRGANLECGLDGGDVRSDGFNNALVLGEAADLLAPPCKQIRDEF